MNNDYKKLDINILKDFMEGEEHDVYLLIKKLFFKDMYMTLYEYSFKDLEDNDTLETFLEVAFKAYRTQNKLNQCLKVRDGKYYDEFLIKSSKLGHNNYPIIDKKGYCHGLIRVTEITEKRKGGKRRNKGCW